MRMHQLRALCLLLFVIPGIALAQQGTVSGIVTDAESGDPLPGANVVLSQIRQGAATDLDGRFTISAVPYGTYTLTVSFIGYRTIEREVSVQSPTTDVSVALMPDYTGLEEVVVTGIASATSKARAEVAVSRIDAEQLQENYAYQDVSQLMNGKITGVSVQPASGNIGGGIRFVMRSSTGLNGDGQPVIYVDGVRIDNAEVEGFGVGGQGVSMLANLNPEDIASIDVLKGPAGAALYGTSGSNGVVLITTKRGQLAGATARPFSVSYKGVYGANSQAREYTKFNAGTPETANAFFRNGLISQHNVAVSGGSNQVRYFASYDKRLEEGHLPNNQQDRQSFRANFEAFPVQNVTIRANTGYTLNEIARPQNDNNILGYLGNTLLSTTPFNFTDSLAIESIADDQRIQRFVGSADVEWQPLPRLQLRASVGYDGTNLRQDQTYPANLSYSGVVNGERNIYNRTNQQYTYDFNARYSYDITPSLNATTLVGAQAFNRILRTSFFTKQNFSTELIKNIGAGADFIDGDEGFLHAREAGIFAQQEFAFQNRFFATLGLRRDFATAIGSEAAAIYYPKASLAIRIDEFDVLPAAINFLKLRTAYGETGQLPGLLDASRLRWEAEPSGYGAGAVLDFIGNVEIEPERIREIEFGLEAEFLNNIGLETTYYLQSATNSIIDFANVPSSGLTASDVPFNVGEARGWGIETSLSASPLRTRNYGLDLTFIWNYQDNEVRDLGGAQPIYDGFDINVIKEGMPRSAFYTWGTRATFNEDGSYAGPELIPGDEDADGRRFYGIPYPKHNGSFSMNVRFLKNFNLNVLADWQLGGSIFNNTAYFQTLFGANYRRNVLGAQLGLRPFDPDGEDGPEAPIEALEVGSDAYRAAAEEYAGMETSFQGVSTDGNYIEEADFLKLREVSLRYDFTDLIRKYTNDQIRSISFTLSARNLWMTTKYSGADPEVNFDGSRSASRATDFLTLPQPRSIYGSLSITF
ncbi:MAG: TonB-dependent receptor [Bacteroidetes bacterium]|nr:MAG: TonB-dependent receptor [Bacteroidota bacterium]